MNVVKNFFIDLGFDFATTLSKPNKHFMTGEIELKEILNNKIFFFKSPNQTNTSFYLVTIPLIQKDFDILRRYIWNENKADLLFYTSSVENNILIDLFYSKASPMLDKAECKLDTFKPTEKDHEKIKKISRWQFESGSFWLNYHTFLKRSAQKSIDKELIDVLNVLKNDLHLAISKIEKEKEKIEEVVQALIDRTLYIKYLEDNHIINSFFYDLYFSSSKINYKTLLEHRKRKQLNKLFKEIHAIFNNSLFDRPNIEDQFLNDEVCDFIYHSLSGTNRKTGQLRLLDFQFEVIPVEFISYIYEIFLSEKQKDNGIFYTPKKLAQLIIDDVILDNKIGKVLDPSCGSGMFLIVAFQKLLENSNERNFKDIGKRIAHRTKLLSDNIFGIEKEISAQRFTIFSLSLQLFRDLEPSQIKEYIANQLKENGKVDLFQKFNFYNNIVKGNALDESNPHFENITFDYIVGNPPFFEIKNTDIEISFLNNYNFRTGNKILKVKDIIGNHQISQCFLLKIKDWSYRGTRFGFVSNSSNFYNDNSKKFQNFFYSNYNIEKIYELSKVKKILFEKAKESVVSIIFTNLKRQENILEYYSVDMGMFSEKPFELLIIQEDKMIELKQSRLKYNQIALRDFLTGNELDRALISKIGANSKISNFTNSIDRGFEIWGEDARKKEFNLSNEKWKKLNASQKEDYLEKFIRKYFNDSYTKEFNKPYIKPKNLRPFVKQDSEQFINNIDNFHRPRINKEIYLGQKLIFTRIGSKLNCVYSKDEDYFDFSIYTFKLQNQKLYYLFQALLNSNIIQFYLDYYLRKRLLDSFSRIGNEDILDIPVPKELDEDIVKQISAISKNLSRRKYKFNSEIEKELNELVFDLYDLSYIEKQRIRDHFIQKEKVSKTKGELETYKKTLIDTIAFFFNGKIEIEFSNQNQLPIVAKINFKDKNFKTPSADKTAYFLLNEIFEKNPNENFLASQEKIYSKNCVYIIKDNQNINWTQTKAFEDGQDILKHIS